MYGGFSIISVTNDICEVKIGAVTEQRNGFKLHSDTDLNLKSVNENTVKLFDTVDNAYIDSYVSYYKRDISISPKIVQMHPGRKYTVQVVSGQLGVKDILGYALEDDYVYDITFNETVILKSPIITDPAQNATVNSVSITVDYGDSDSCIVEIDDNIKFSSPLYSEEIFVDTFTPAFTFQDKQYYIRAKAKKKFIDESNSNEVFSQSDYSAPVQFFYETSSQVTPVPVQTQDLYIIKSMPENEESLVSDTNVMILMNKDVSSYTVDVKIFSSDVSMIDFYKDDIQTFSTAGVLTPCTGTLTVSKNLIKYTLDTIGKSLAYYIVVSVTDNAVEIFNEALSFSSAARSLYISYEYIVNDVKNFDTTKEYVMEKVQKACDMADYVSLTKINAADVKYKVMEYVRNKALLDMVVDYQLGYIQLLSGAIGSFQFQLSNANVASVESAIKQLTATIKYWEAALKGYEKPGNAAPDYAVRASGSGPSRTVI